MLRARNAAANSPEDLSRLIGRKLTLLFKIEGDSEHPFSEAVGLLQRVVSTDSGSELYILKRNGEIVVVAESAIVSYKVIPT
ncbi:MAG: hypothetical protein KY429_03495 [Actinobacteria bacterium]|nr:hypothetical protein [Actinomycetota bacterium]